MSALGKKVGPLPLGAWLIIGVAGIVAGLWLKHRLGAASNSSVGATAVPATSSTGTSFPDVGTAVPTGGASGSSGSSYGASDVTGAYQSGLTDATTSLGNAVSLIEQIQQAFGIGLGTSAPVDGTVPPGSTGGAGGYAPVYNPPTQTGPPHPSLVPTVKQAVQTFVNPKTGVQFRVVGSRVDEKAKGGTWYPSNHTGQLPPGLKRIG